MKLKLILGMVNIVIFKSFYCFNLDFQRKGSEEAIYLYCGDHQHFQWMNEQLIKNANPEANPQLFRILCENMDKQRNQSTKNICVSVRSTWVLVWRNNFLKGKKLDKATVLKAGSKIGTSSKQRFSSFITRIPGDISWNFLKMSMSTCPEQK